MSDTQLPNGCLLNACYSIEKVLGRGGFGITYLATDTKLNLPVAVKEYLPAPFASRTETLDVEPFGSKQYEFEWGLSRFLSEAQILAQFKHPNIVRVNAAFEQYGTAYMVMEYEEGVDLSDYIRQEDSDRSQAFFEKLMRSIMGGLQGIHDKGFIHRDIKPANLMVRNDFEKTPVLIDFGSARSTAGSETGQLTAVTSAGYSPVEQHNTGLGEQGPWTDIYALAAAIREGITREVPRAALDREFAVRAGADNDPIKPLTRIYVDRGFSQEFLHAIDVGLSIMPADRPQSLADWRAMLDGAPLPPMASIDQDSVATQVEITPATAAQAASTEARDIPAAGAVASEQMTAIPPPSDRVAPAQGLVADAVSNNETAVPDRAAPGAISGAGAEAKKGGVNKALLAGGLAAAGIAAGAFLFLQMGADDVADGTVDVVVDQPVVAEPPEVTGQPVVVDTAPLPRPAAPIELISPVDRVKQQVVALNAAADPFVQLVSSSGAIPATAAEPIEMLLIKYKSLSESEIVRAFPDLKMEVGTGLDKLSIANADASQVKQALDNAAIAGVDDIDGLLQGWKDLAGEQRSKLIFALASLSTEQRSSLSKQTELSALIEQINTSIKSRIEARDFQNAARIVEVAMLFGSGDETLEGYKTLLESSE